MIRSCVMGSPHKKGGSPMEKKWGASPPFPSTSIWLYIQAVIFLSEERIGRYAKEPCGTVLLSFCFSSIFSFSGFCWCPSSHSAHRCADSPSLCHHLRLQSLPLRGGFRSYRCGISALFAPICTTPALVSHGLGALLPPCLRRRLAIPPLRRR